MNNNWLSKLNRKFGRYAIHNLMLYIIIVQAVMFVAAAVLGVNFTDYLYFYLPAIMSGQVWRLITFIFVPPGFSIFAILTMYFSWLIGSALENEWGAFKFNVFYLTGVIGTILGGLITQTTTNAYLNLSLFLAFAIIYPEFEILLFFILPIKVKFLAFIYAAVLVISLIVSDWAVKVAIVVSLLNLILYFGPQMLDRIRAWRRRAQWKRSFR